LATYTRTVDPTQEPVTVDQLKEHARILHTYEDTLLEGNLLVARARCEKQIGQSFVTQTWELKADRWPHCTPQNPHRAIELAYGPLQAVSSVEYYNTSDVLTTMPSSDYVVSIGNIGRIAPGFNKYWPATISRLDAIKVTFLAGYGGASASTDAVASANAVPRMAKHAIKVFAQHLYQVRDEDAPVPQLVSDMLETVSFGTYRSISPDAY
jgi:uncharacterized phiE125 gp8 family phage protein